MMFIWNPSFECLWKDFVKIHTKPVSLEKWWLSLSSAIIYINQENISHSVNIHSKQRPNTVRPIFYASCWYISVYCVVVIPTKEYIPAVWKSLSSKTHLQMSPKPVLLFSSKMAQLLKWIVLNSTILSPMMDSWRFIPLSIMIRKTPNQCRVSSRRALFGEWFVTRISTEWNN